jgi:alpha-ketoglutarate-dependent taurine dioxygenase
MKIIFCCLKPPASGGTTPVVNCRDVLRRLNPRLREQFVSRGVMYVRNFTDGLDVGWRDFFRTDSRQQVEEICRRTGTEWEWLADGTLRTRRVCRAVARHPKTGEEVMFNQVQAHHVSLLEDSVRESLLSLFGEEGLPRNVYYGDGGRISAGEMAELVQTYEAGAVDFPWEEDEVLLVDNMLVAHGRRPYIGERKIVVAMGQMITEQELANASRPFVMAAGEQ